WSSSFVLGEAHLIGLKADAGGRAIRALKGTNDLLHDAIGIGDLIDIALILAALCGFLLAETASIGGEIEGAMRQEEMGEDVDRTIAFTDGLDLFHLGGNALALRIVPIEPHGQRRVGQGMEERAQDGAP